MSHKVTNGDVVLAGIEIAGLKRLVKTRSLGPNSTQQFQRSPIGKLRRVNRIEVVKHRAVRLHTLPDPSRGLPRELPLHPEVLVKDNVGTETGIGAAGQRL